MTPTVRARERLLQRAHRIFAAPSLRRILARYLEYYHRARTHLSLDKDAPDVRSVEPPGAGRIVEIPEVGGLHHRFRGAGAYPSKHPGISIDTDLVDGADSQGKGGRFKTEPGPRAPRALTTRIHPVLLPCYVQDEVVIRPTAVRLGDFRCGST